MKTTMKKALALMLALVLLLGCVACTAKTESASETPAQTSETKSDLSAQTNEAKPESSEKKAYYNETGYPICDEPIALTMMCIAEGNMNLNDRIMIGVLEEKLGIKLEITGYSDADDFITQLNLAMTTGDLPDIIAPSGKLSMSQLQQYVDDGYVLALSDYADLMPNLYEVFAEYPAYQKYLTLSDGNIYGLTKLEVNDIGRVDRVFINHNWLENVGMECPTSVDELYDVLCAFRDLDANGNGDPTDEIPFDYVATNYDDDHMLLSAFGLNTNDSNYILTDDGSGKVVFGNTSEQYKDFLKYMKKLYNEGLINSECYVATTDERKEHVANDTAGFFAASAPFAWAGVNVAYDANFFWVGGLTSADNAVATVPMSNIASNKIRIFANADTEYPEAVARFLDYWYTLEGEIAFQRGWEGITMEYTYNETLQGDIADLYCPDGFSSTNDYKVNEALVVGPFDLCSRANGTAYRLIMDASEDVLWSDAALNERGWAVLVERGLRRDGVMEEDIFPALVYTAEEENERTSLYNDLTTYIASQRAEFITNSDVDIDAAWDTYVAQLEAMGLSRAMEIEQAAYDRYNNG